MPEASGASASHSRWPIRVSARSALLAPLILVLVWAVSATVLAIFGLKMSTWDPDEFVYTRFAIGIAHQLSPFTTDTDGIANRLNQLYPLLIAPLWGPLSTVTAYQLSHVWNAILITSATVPVYLLCRQVVDSRWCAVGAAAIVAVMPWLTVATGELTEVAAFPAGAWALLAMQRCLDQPSPRRDVVALLAIVLATYGRLQLAILAPALAIAAVIHELAAARLDARTPAERRRLALRRLGRDHVVLSVITLLAIVIGVPLLLTGVLGSALGFYGNTVSGVSLGGATFSSSRSYLTALTLGLGGVPVAMTVGFVLSALVAPLDRRAHAFATLTLVTIVLVIVQVAELTVRFAGALIEERYVFYVVPLLAVGMFAAVRRTRRPGVTVLAGGIVVGALVATTSYAAGTSAFWFQISPAFAAFQGWVVSGLGASVIRHSMIWAGLAIVLASGIVALWSAPQARTATLSVLTGLVVIFCAAETLHGLHVVVFGTSTGPGLGGGSIADSNWVDARVVSDARVIEYLGTRGGYASDTADWTNLPFWNRRVNGTATLRIGGRATDSVTTVDPRTGQLVLPPNLHPSAAQPFYAVTSPGTDQAAPIGQPIAHSPDGMLQLIRLTPPVRVSYLISGIAPRTFALPRRRAATLRIYPGASDSRRCSSVAFAFMAAATTPHREVLDVSTGSWHERVALLAGQQAFANHRVCAARPDAVARLTLRTSPPGGSRAAVAPALLALKVSPR